MRKLKDYFGRSDFEEYFKHPNQTGVEDYVRERLIGKDFEGSYFSVRSLLGFIIVVAPIKWIVLLIGEYYI